jgi:hypothetical protein
MRRVLIVHYHFLPVHNVAVKRLVGYARHLRDFGWEPLFLARDWRDLNGVDPSWGLSWEPDIQAREGLSCIRVPHDPRRYRLPRASDRWPIRKALSFGHMLAGAYPDAFIDWAAPAVDAAMAAWRRTPFDAVITYCPPETNLVVGSRLARRLRVPWIPFFGDLYGFFLARLSSWGPGSVIRRFYHRRWMAPAAACAGVSPYMADYLTRTYGKPSAVVLTGFEPAEFENGCDGPAEGARWVVSHVGSLYPGDQRPEIFFEGVDRLLDAHPDAGAALEIRFVGSKCEAYLRDLIAGRPCARVTRVLPKVPPAAAVDMLTGSHLLLAFTCTAHRAGHGTMSYPTKVFEAFGARRPILVVPPDGDWVDTLLARTGAGRTAADADSVAEILWDAFEAWRVDGAVPHGATPETVEMYTVRRQTEHLAGLLQTVAGEGEATAHRGLCP